MPSHSSPARKKVPRKQRPKVWAEADPDGQGAAFGVVGGILLRVKYSKGRLEVETTDSNTRVEIEPWSTDLRVVFSKRPKNVIVPMSD